MVQKSLDQSERMFLLTIISQERVDNLYVMSIHRKDKFTHSC